MTQLGSMLRVLQDISQGCVLTQRLSCGRICSHSLGSVPSLPLFSVGCWLLFLKSTSRPCCLGFLCMHAYVSCQQKEYLCLISRQNLIQRNTITLCAL